VEDAQARGRIAALTGEMRSLERKADAAYAQFQEARLQMIEASQHLAVLQRLESITSIIGAGIKAGELLTKDNNVATASSGSPYPIAEQIRVTETRVDKATGEVRTKELEYTRYDTQVRQRETAVRKLYNDNGVEVPPRY
jgi:hypothetical protein